MKTELSFFILLIIVLLFSNCSDLRLEHKDARNVIIKEIDFEYLSDGEYSGYYSGGIKSWRENEVKVTVDSGKVSNIVLVSSKSEYSDEFITKLYDLIIDNQTLKIDAVSGATLDTKACLKSIEDALIKSEKTKQE